MTAATEAGQRIVTLDIVRGVAVMGILAMNIVAFAMPPAAYVNPLAYGADRAVDLAAYAFNFVFIDGKMRGLFSFLFGASMLLVIQLAARSGESPWSVTYRRQLWLLLFGMIHYYLIWFGDILIGYALIGMLAWFFRNHPPSKLVAWGIGLVTMQFMAMAGIAAFAQSLAADLATNPTPAKFAAWNELTRDAAIPTAEQLKATMALYLGPWSGIVEYQTTEKLWMPVVFTFLFGWETLGYMLFGMAALKSGFLTGGWDDRGYRRAALITFGIAVPGFAFLAYRIFAEGFSPEALFTWSFAGSTPFRPVMVVGYAALIILVSRGGGWLVDRIAATGRAAFSNYLGTSLVMTAIFYGWGLGLFGALTRAELWLVVIAAWVVMLAWSKPWLDRYRYGPLEWLWRSLARWALQPMRQARPDLAEAGT